MVVTSTIPSIVLTKMLYSVGRLVSVRARMVRNVENRVYSKNWVTLDILINLIIVAVSAVVFFCTAAEKPNVPVRVWLFGHLVQCLIHVALVLCEYWAKRSIELHLEAAGLNVDDDDNAFVVFILSRVSFAYRYDYLNMLASIVWVTVGLHWIQSGGKLLARNAPWLYRLTVAYQTYDVIFVMFFVAGIVVCCSLSCIIGLRYPVAGQKQEGASEAELSLPPKYRFHMSSNGEKPSAGAGVIVPMDTSSGDLASERVVLPEDSGCCICLCSYDDEIELHVLPCNHHFHATCIEKWLKINPACPVCNYNILKESV